MAATQVLVIPTAEGAAFYTTRVRLDGREYTLKFRYSQRSDTWFMGLFDERGDPIHESIRLTTDWPLLRYLKHDSRTPPGELIAQTLTIDKSPAGFDELGVGERVELTYYAATET